jgi:hypothetical protein
MMRTLVVLMLSTRATAGCLIGFPQVEDRLVLVVVLKVGNRADVYQRVRESDLDFLQSLIAK